jgi:hypothetical protein
MTSIVVNSSGWQIRLYTLVKKPKISGSPLGNVSAIRPTFRR